MIKRGRVIILILAFLIIFLISIFSFNFSDFWNKLTGKTIAYYCIDSDENNPFVKGTVYYKNVNYTDFCFDKNRKVKEYYCDNRSRVNYQNYNCNNRCLTGACKISP